MFLGFGEIMARIAPPGGLRWRQALPGAVQVTWGGGEANVCASLALLGQQARFLTALPKTPIAEALVATLRGLDVDMSHVLWRKEGRLGLYFVDLVIANEEDAADVLGIHASQTDVAAGKIDAAAYTSVAEQMVAQFPNVKHVAITLRESISADHNNWGAMLYVTAERQAHFAP